MDNVDLNVLRQVAAWLEAGQRAVLGTVTRTWGSAPRPVGSVVAVRGDGVIAGSVSGGCIEDDLIEKVRAGRAGAHAHPEIVRYGVERRGGAALRPALRRHAWSWCSSRVERSRHPRAADAARGAASCVAPRARSGDGRGHLSAGRRAAMRCVRRARASSPCTARAGGCCSIGAGQLSQYLAQMAQALDYQVTICDPREEYPAEPEPAGRRAACATCPTTRCSTAAPTAHAPSSR